MLARFSLIALLSLVVFGTHDPSPGVGEMRPNSAGASVEQEAAPKPPPPSPCDAICYTYRQEVRQERAQRQSEGYKYYSPLQVKNDEEILRLHLVDRHPFAPIDDDLWVLYNSREVWRITYPARSKGDAVIHASELTHGSNSIQIWYQNTQGPDANFSFALGGLAFCPSVAACHDYDEGITYGTGLLQKTVSQQGFGLFGRGQVLPEAKIWRSTVDDPPSSCGCKDP